MFYVQLERNQRCSRWQWRFTELDRWCVGNFYEIGSDSQRMWSILWIKSTVSFWLYSNFCSFLIAYLVQKYLILVLKHVELFMPKELSQLAQFSPYSIEINHKTTWFFVFLYRRCYTKLFTTGRTEVNRLLNALSDVIFKCIFILVSVFFFFVQTVSLYVSFLSLCFKCFFYSKKKKKNRRVFYVRL